jgi:predicted nucleic acid-binding protein
MTAGVICIDANFVVGLVIPVTPESPYRDLWAQWQESGHTIVAPALIYYEVSNALHRLAVARVLLPERAAQLLDDALNLNIRIYGDAELHRHALNMAATLRLPATYDAHYLALAEQLSAEFWTADRRLFQAVRATFYWVHLVGEV